MKAWLDRWAIWPPGPCEMPLEGLKYSGDQPAPELWMVVRSFDPCMQCTVH
ncbi:MAG: hypothetical protein RRB13_10460 [bacterium]|nr:hypothetical protein [bacterium]